jgi:hypothetical protein
MRLEDFRDLYGSYARTSRELGMGSSSYLMWQRQGYIPISTQIKIEQMTNGKLQANLGDVEPYLSKGISFDRKTKR